MFVFNSRGVILYVDEQFNALLQETLSLDKSIPKLCFSQQCNSVLLFGRAFTPPLRLNHPMTWLIDQLPTKLVKGRNSWN